MSMTEYYIWRLRRLHIEKGIYSPIFVSSSSNYDWKQMYHEMFQLRYLWNNDNDNNNEISYRSGMNKDVQKQNTISSSNESDFHVSVCARFRPKKSQAKDFHQNNKRITLPLHQRLSIIKITNKITSNREALKILHDNGGWFHDRKIQVSDNINQDDSSGQDCLKSGIHTIDYDKNAFIIVDAIKGLCKIQFDNIMPDTSSQMEVYENTAMKHVNDLINGCNASCLVYGQTGSGKTYTMFGDDNYDDKIPIHMNTPPRHWGIVQRSCWEVIQAMEYRKKHMNLELDCHLRITYVEIFGDTVLDLLRKGVACGHSRVSAQRYVLDGSSEVPVSSFHDIIMLLKKGKQQKRQAATAMNERSSRAHTLFILTLTQNCRARNIHYTSRLFLADLGGCEQLKKSIFDQTNTKQRFVTRNDADEQFMQSQQVKEAVNINLGLLALKQCVDKLNQKSRHIPYADSKLTMLLSPGFGVNSKTTVIVCAAHEMEYSAETVNAIKFGRTCRKISKQMTREKFHMMEELLNKIDFDIRECEKLIQKKERWETIEKRRIDECGEIEIKKVTILMGADDERNRMEELLRKKSELIGFSDSKYHDVLKYSEKV